MRLLFLISLLFPVIANADLQFKYNSKDHMTLTNTQMKKLVGDNAFLKVKNERLYDPVAKKTTVYTGLDFFLLMDHVYGINWRKGNKILFKALDGYQISAKIPDMLKAAREDRRGFLAIGEDGSENFKSFKKGKRKIDPGPYYLVWSSFEKGDLKKYRKTLPWPYQLKSIELKAP